MTNEELIADERYHVCGRCKWEGIPFLCNRCKWGEDTRKDLWELKENVENEDEKMSDIEKAIDVVKSECYVFNPLNMDRTTMVNKALDTLIEAAKRYDESEDKDNGRRE